MDIVIENKHANKKRWTEEENSTLLALVPEFGSDYDRYMTFLSRSRSCVKSQFHNLKKRRMIVWDEQLGRFSVDLRPTETERKPRKQPALTNKDFI